MSDKRRLMAVVFTDIVGFSTMTAEDEATTVRIVREHRDIVRALLPDHGGREMRTVGDAFLLLFESAVDAVRFGIAVQERMAARNAPLPAREQVWMRIGVHAGEVFLGHEGELYGETVNLAARVEPHAPPGGLCVTDVVHAQVKAHVPRAFEKLGVVPLKNVDAPPALFRLAVGRQIAPARRRPSGRWIAFASGALAVAALAWGIGALRSGPQGVRVSDVPEAQRLYDAAMTSLAGGELTTFEQQVRKALERDPSASRLLLTRSLFEPDQAAAGDLRQKAVALAPPGPDGDLVRLVDRALRAGDDPELARAWDRWGEAHPDDVEGQVFRAMTYPPHGEHGLESHHGGPHEHGPLLQLRALVEAHPDHLFARMQLAHHEMGHGRPDAAVAQLDEALSRCTSCALFHSLRGQLLVAAGRFDEGARSQQMAAELDPSLPGLRESLAQVALRRGDEVERARRVEAVLADDVVPASARAQFAAGHGQELLAHGQFLAGRALIGRGLELADPAFRVQALQDWANTELVYGHLEVARELLARLAETAADPATPGFVRDQAALNALTMRGWIAFQERDVDEVREVDERLRALPDERFVGVPPWAAREPAARNLAALTGRLDEALALARKPAPGCGRDLVEGDLLEAAGRDAREVWVRAAADETCDGPVGAIVRIRAAEIAVTSGDLGRAGELTTRVRERWRNADPDSPWALRLTAVEAQIQPR